MLIGSSIAQLRTQGKDGEGQLRRQPQLIAALESTRPAMVGSSLRASGPLARGAHQRERLWVTPSSTVGCLPHLVATVSGSRVRRSSSHPEPNCRGASSGPPTRSRMPTVTRHVAGPIMDSRGTQMSMQSSSIAPASLAGAVACCSTANGDRSTVLGDCVSSAPSVCIVTIDRWMTGTS